MRPLTFPLGAKGRLGNQLHQLAATVGLARSRNQPLAFPEDWPYRRWFSIPDAWFGPCNDAEDAGVLFRRLVRALPRFRIYGQDFDLWRHAADEVWAALQPSEEASACLPGPTSAVAMHVRRGDYANYGDGYFPLLGGDYYRAAYTGIVAHTNSQPPIDIFTDDPDWCRANLWTGLDVTSPDDWYDLLRMTLYRHHIIANSSFSWWGAFLSRDSEVRYPSRWYGPKIDSPWRSLIQPGWVEVPA